MQATTRNLVPLAILLSPAATLAGEHGLWLGADLGTGGVSSSAPAPSADRQGLAASLDLGYHVTPNWGLGVELGTLLPTSGCADWPCRDPNAKFSPGFSRSLAFTEFRPRGSHWRLRAGAGESRFCYSRHWSNSAWSLGDTLNVVLVVVFDEQTDVGDYSGSGAYVCDRKASALAFSASLGYDWAPSDSPVSVGWRLSTEGANFHSTPAGMPAFHHRAVMLTLHLAIN